MTLSINIFEVIVPNSKEFNSYMQSGPGSRESCLLYMFDKIFETNEFYREFLMRVTHY